MSDRPTVLFYVQHLLGIGHLRRAAAIACALDRGGFAVAFVSGGEPVPGLELGGAELIQLPPARAGDSSFGVLLDDQGRPIDEAWRERRRALLLEIFERRAPDAVLIELYPFGRRPFRFELQPLLEAAAARRPRPVVLCSVRDILVGKSDPKRTADVVAAIRRWFDLVLVHGDPQLIAFGDTFAGADDIAGRLHYTGYVVNAPPAPSADRPGLDEVLVSAGGGVVGAPLLRAALACRPLTALAGLRWRLVGGMNLPEGEFQALQKCAPTGVIVERHRPDFQALLRNCRLSISQAGYNTVMELLQAGATAVVVPFAAAGETEQTLRAQLLARRGLLTVVEPETLTATSLAAGIAAALGAPRSTVAFNLSGTAGTVAAIRDVIAKRRGDA